MDEKLIYRRQFIFGPREINGLMDWKRYSAPGGYFLAVHPDLDVVCGTSSDREWILLGYILDPYNPSMDNKAVVQSVFENSTTPQELFQNLSPTCGRYAVIAKFGNDVRIFGDTAGLRQIFHYRDSFGGIWCGSQPSIIAEQCELTADNDITSDLNRLNLFSQNMDYWYPGSATIYQHVRHLTPNHYLDVGSYRVFRYWPWEKLRELSIEECASRASKILTGIFHAATNRFPLALVVTCGLDSRILLAASKDVSQKIYYFTHKHAGLNDDHPDLVIPSNLLRDLGLEHHIVANQGKPDDIFISLFRKCVTTARTSKGINAYSILTYFREHYGSMNRVVVYGNLGEISRRDRGRFPKMLNFMITPTSVSTMTFMYGSKVAEDEFGRWLNSVRVVSKFGISILDLCHWEQRVGNWAAMTFSEYDLAFDTLLPYNCRAYLELMLSVPFRYRTRPGYHLHKAIISNLWKEVLSYPISPTNKPIKEIIYNVFYKLSIYDVVKYAYLMTLGRQKQ